jgi:hypothetical protein
MEVRIDESRYDEQARCVDLLRGLRHKVRLDGDHAPVFHRDIDECIATSNVVGQCSATDDEIHGWFLGRWAGVRCRGSEAPAFA